MRVAFSHVTTAQGYKDALAFKVETVGLREISLEVQARQGLF